MTPGRRGCRRVVLPDITSFPSAPPGVGIEQQDRHTTNALAPPAPHVRRRRAAGPAVAASRDICSSVSSPPGRPPQLQGERAAKTRSRVRWLRRPVLSRNGVMGAVWLKIAAKLTPDGGPALGRNEHGRCRLARSLGSIILYGIPCDASDSTTTQSPRRMTAACCHR